MTRTTPGPLIVIGVIGLVIGVLLQVGLAAMNMPKLRPEFSLAITLVLTPVCRVGARRFGFVAKTKDRVVPAFRNLDER